MLQEEFQETFLKFIGAITNKRAKIVIDHILANGFITTEDLETTYGYNHPPRAARDVREAGIPLETFKVKSTQGKSIAAYKFGDLNKIEHNKIAGRLSFSKKFKHKLFIECNGKCAICNGSFEERYLQVDHRVPYEINGELDNFIQFIKDYMLLCPSCNRTKSWSCEHCDNWLTKKEEALCMKCYWGNPEDYTHVALQEIRRLELTWQSSEVQYFETLKTEAEKKHIDLPTFVKEILKKMNESNKS
jgi:HNH endonuclease